MFLLFMVRIHLEQRKFREIVKNERIKNSKPWLPPLFGIEENDMSEICRNQKIKVLKLYYCIVSILIFSFGLIVTINIIYNYML